MGFLDHKLATRRANPYKTYSKGQQRNTRVEEIGQEGHDENHTPLVSFPLKKHTAKLCSSVRYAEMGSHSMLCVPLFQKHILLSQV
jgi:hypothetical protein